MNLPLSIKMYTYHGEPQAFDTLGSESALLKSSCTRSEFLLFHASGKTINTIMNPQRERYIARFCASFDTREQLPTRQNSLFASNCSLQIDALYDQRSPEAYGLAQISPRIPLHVIRSYPVETRGRQPDHSWGPKSKPPDISRSPSITLEVAY